MTRIPVGSPSRSVTALGWALAVLGVAMLAALAIPQMRGSLLSALALATLAVLFAVMGVGLLQRLDWARRVFVVLLGSGLAGVTLVLWPQWQWLQSASSIEGPLAALLGTLGVAAALGLALQRLLSPRVRREFA